MVQLTRAGAVCAASAFDLKRLRGQFDRLHCILLPSLLEPGLLHIIERQIEGATFNHRVHEGIGAELCMADDVASHLLHFLVNDPQLFKTIRRITGCGRIGCFSGRVYRMLPGSHHFDSWHDDLFDHRMIGMSINLSTWVYSGGIFQIRNLRSPHMVHEVTNVSLADAIIFRLSPQLQHRVTRVEGSVPKTAFAGWFRSEPDFYAELRKMPSSRLS